MNEKKRLLAFVAGGIVVALGLGGLVYYQYRSLERSRLEAADLRSKIDESRQLIKKTPDLVKSVILARETDATIKTILSDEADANNFVQTLSQFEKKSGVTVLSMKQQKSGRVDKKNKEDFTRIAYTLSLDADAFQLLALLDEIESHPRLMSVTALKLQGAKRSSFAKAGDLPRHKVTLDLETYVYRPKEGSQEVRIDHYERKRDLLASEIAQRTAEIMVPDYDYLGPQGRRDPWVDPRVPVNSESGPTLTIEEQIAIVDELEQRVIAAVSLWESAQSAENLIAEMKARSELEETLALVEADIKKIEVEGSLVFLPAQRRFEKQVVTVAVELRESMGTNEGTRGPSLAALKEAAETMDRHIVRGEYELAIEAYRSLEPRLAIAEREEAKRAFVQALRELERLARTVIEFEAIELSIGGIAVYEGRRPVALINGQAIAEGELVGEELLVRNITAQQIEFAYRGLVLARRVESLVKEPTKKTRTR